MKIVSYFFAGGAAALVDWSVFWGLISGLGVHYLIAAVISFMIATLVNYILSVRFVFQSGVRFSRRHETALVYLVSAIGLGINVLVLQLLVSAFSVHLLVAKIAATGVVFLWNYFARAAFIFKSDPKP
jgi:putative flippase GtrA